MTKYAIIIPASMRPHIVPYQDELSWLQNNVGGLIEIVNCEHDSNMVMVISDTGKIDGLPTNYLASILYGEHGDYIAGPAILLRRKGPELIGMSNEEAGRICSVLASIYHEWFCEDDTYSSAEKA